MRGLHLLIELARREADERRSQLAEISFAKADTEAALVAHRDGIASEGRVAFDDPAILATLGPWCRHAVRARANLLARNRELARGETAARDALQSAFIDLKRLEIAQREAVRRGQVAAMRRAEIRADELYVTGRSFASV